MVLENNHVVETATRFADVCTWAPAHLEHIQANMNCNRFVLEVTLRDVLDAEEDSVILERFATKPTKRQIRKAVKQCKIAWHV